MESEPDMTNLVFMDEYPELIARREVKLALGGLKRILNTDPTVLQFPYRFEDDAPDPAA